MIPESPSNDIAIIGMACRFPGAPDLRSFWDLLRMGREGISHFTEEALRNAGVPIAELKDPEYVRSYGWLEGLDLFDATFFGYTPREARLMDPQHRLFLETCWLALEHAGHPPEKIHVPTGVFAGAGPNTYRLEHLLTNPGALETVSALETTLGNDLDFLTTRVSYKLNLTGPSLDVQSADSTALVAVHLAVQSLLAAECDLALAGAVSIASPRKAGYRYHPGGDFSPDGHTRTFDAQAQGTVWGDGVGVVALKRLEDALADGDIVHAVIKGTAVNNDGGQRDVFTDPAVTGQAQAIVEALSMSGVSPEEIDFVELHGSGIPREDGVEFAALRKVFERAGIQHGRIALGSAKPSIGHTRAAAGAAGLIKTVLALRHRSLPASLHFERPAPNLDLANSPFFINTELRSLSAPAGRPLRAGVSSFGTGGTNAHVIVEEAPRQAGRVDGIFSDGTPFDRRRYWIEPGRPEPNQNETIRKTEPADWFYVPSWKRTPAPTAPEDFTTGRWLMFSGDDPLSRGLEKALETNKHVVIVRKGEDFSETPSGFTLRPGRPEDYERLAARLKSEAHTPDHVLHLWNLVPSAPDLSAALDLSFFSLLFLASALHGVAPGARVRMAAVTRNMQSVTGEEPGAPLQAAVLGPVRVIPIEMESIYCASIDIDTLDSPDLPCKILSELLAGQDPVVAYRYGQRWKETFRPYPVRQAEKDSLPLRKGGVFWIIGASGGIGSVLARHLAVRWQARLALVSRSGVPDETVAELEAAGAEVLAFQADMSDKARMQQILDRIHEHFGKLDGVVHAAGLPGGGAIEVKSREAAETVLKAKVHGTLVLDALLEQEKPGFILLCSSLAAELGGYGQVDYAAANAFQDAYAAGASAGGRRVIALAWDTWKDSGMAVNTPVPKALQAQRAASLANGLSNEEGVDVFERALAAGLPRLLVSTVDFNRRLREKHLVASADSESPEREDEEISLERPEPLTPLQARVAVVWEQMFGMAPISLHADFFQLGGHSLLATQILNRLHRDIEGIEISMRDLFEEPTIAGIAARIETRLAKAEGKSGLSAGKLAGLSQEARRAQLTSYLEFALAGEPVTDRIADLIWLFKRDFDLRVYPQELRERTSIPDLANFLDRLLSPIDAGGAKSPAPVPAIPTSQTEPLAKKNPTAVFILSAPRSGSTLLRLMLNAHSQLFAPPELALLAFDSLAAWRKNQRAMFAVDGLTQALAAAGIEDASGRIERWVTEDLPVQAAYRQLQEAASPRTLVDKTPGYSMHPVILARAEVWFDAPKYIHLIRHPVPVIDSFARNRMHVVLGQPGADPHNLGEWVWQNWNGNINAHLEGISPDRQFRVRYEDLVRDPAGRMQAVCRFLGIPFEDAVLHPYRQETLLAGPGDPDILLHERIDPSLADAWQDFSLPVELSAATREMLPDYGYPPPDTVPGMGSLSDEDVDRLLQQLLEDEDTE